MIFLVIAAISRWNGISMRACFRVAQKAADALVQLGADDVFELTCLRVRFVLINPETYL